MRLLISAILLFASGLSAQSPVADIDREAAAVQRILPSLKKDSAELTGYSAEGGVAVIYRNGTGAIPLIHAHLFGEGGQSLKDFYFRSGALTMCQEEGQEYNVPMYITDSMAKEMATEAFDPAKTRVVHNRYYFRNGRMVRWENSASVLVAEETPQFREKAQNLISFASELLGRFR